MKSNLTGSFVVEREEKFCGRLHRPQILFPLIQSTVCGYFTSDSVVCACTHVRQSHKIYYGKFSGLRFSSVLRPQDPDTFTPEAPRSRIICMGLRTCCLASAGMRPGTYTLHDILLNHMRSISASFCPRRVFFRWLHLPCLFRGLDPALAQGLWRLASSIQVSTTVSGLSDMLSMPVCINHTAKSG